MAKQVTDEMVRAFKEEWQAADAEGDEGNRVRRALAAALSAPEPESEADIYAHEWQTRSRYSVGDEVTRAWGRDAGRLVGRVQRIFRRGRGPWRVVAAPEGGKPVEFKASDLYRF